MLDKRRANAYVCILSIKVTFYSLFLLTHFSLFLIFRIRSEYAKARVFSYPCAIDIKSRSISTRLSPEFGHA